MRNTASGVISGFGVAILTNGLSITTTRAQVKNVLNMGKSEIQYTRMIGNFLETLILNSL